MVLSTNVYQYTKIRLSMEHLLQKGQKVLFSWNQKSFTMYNKILIYFLMVLSWLYKFVNLYHCDIFKPMILWIQTPLEQEFGMSKRHLSRTVAILPGTKKKAKIDIQLSLQMLVSLEKLEFWFNYRYIDNFR